MKIIDAQQLEKLKSVIGEQNVAGCKRALADGAEVWVFCSREEVLACSELEPEGKEFCLKERFDRGETWAGWIVKPPREIIPGITPSPYHDPHGNLRRDGGDSTGSRH